jgi:Tat protein secretion system quality control protein TatD with DNase activity
LTQLSIAESQGAPVNLVNVHITNKAYSVIINKRRAAESIYHVYTDVVTHGRRKCAAVFHCFVYA